MCVCNRMGNSSSDKRWQYLPAALPAFVNLLVEEAAVFGIDFCEEGQRRVEKMFREQYVGKITRFMDSRVLFVIVSFGGHVSCLWVLNLCEPEKVGTSYMS